MDSDAKKLGKLKMLKLPHGLMVENVNELPNLHGPVLYCDLETTSFDAKTHALDPWKGHRIAGIAIGEEDGPVWYVPIRHHHSNNVDGALNWFRGALKACKLWVNHNVKFDAHFAAADGAEYGGELRCTMTGAKLLDSGRKSYALDSIAEAWLNKRKNQEPWDWLNRAKSKDFGDVPADMAANYACYDVIVTRELDAYIRKMMPEQCKDVWETEQKLTSVLFDTERLGLRVDVLEIKKLESVTRAQMLQLDEELSSLLRFDGFNPSSNDDCFAALCSLNGLPVLGRTDEGNPSFDADTLMQYLEHPVVIEDARLKRAVTNILKYRKLSTLLSLFLVPYQQLEINGRIYPTYNQCVQTGRMSCSKPNAQQMDEVAKSLILPEEAFLSYDYSQIEFRLIAHYAREPEIISAYAKDPDVDFHQWVAELCGIPRGPAKSVNFAIAFGGGKKRVVEMLSSNMSLMEGLDEQLDALISAGKLDANDRSTVFRNLCKQRGESVYAEYHARLPGIRRVTASAAHNLEKRGYVFNLFGRRRHLPSRLSYRAFNSVVQSSAADIMKQRAVATSPRYNSRIRALGLTQRAFVHDEILFHGSVETTRDARVVAEIARELETMTRECLVPMRVSVGWSDKSWAQCKANPVSSAGSPRPPPWTFPPLRRRSRRDGAAGVAGRGWVWPGYDTLPVRRFEFVPLWGIAVFLLYARRRAAPTNPGDKSLFDGHVPALFSRTRLMLLPCAAMNGGGRALPIIKATADLLSVVGNLYRRGKPCRRAASRIVIARSSTG